jgi:hypothetical protein
VLLGWFFVVGLLCGSSGRSFGRENFEAFPEFRGHRLDGDAGIRKRSPCGFVVSLLSFQIIGL